MKSAASGDYTEGAYTGRSALAGESLDRHLLTSTAATPADAMEPSKSIGIVTGLPSSLLRRPHSPGMGLRLRSLSCCKATSPRLSPILEEGEEATSPGRWSATSAQFARLQQTSYTLPAEVQLPAFLDAGGRSWLHPSCVREARRQLQHVVDGVRQRRPGSALEAHAMGDLYGMPVNLWRPAPAAPVTWQRQVLYAGDDGERGAAVPLELADLGDGAWGVFDVAQQAPVDIAAAAPDALYRALVAAVARAGNAWCGRHGEDQPPSLTELRQAVAARLLGGPAHTRPLMAQRNLARIWAARTPGCRALMAYYPCRRLDGSLYLGGGQGQQVCGPDIVWSPVAQSWGFLPAKTALSADYAAELEQLQFFPTPQDDLPWGGLYGALAAWSAVCLDPAAVLVPPSVAACQQVSWALLSHLERPRSGAAPVQSKAWFLDTVQQDARAALQALTKAPLPATEDVLATLTAKVAAFFSVHPYTPFHSGHEARSVGAFLAGCARGGFYLGDTWARTAAEVTGCRVRIWMARNGRWELESLTCHGPAVGTPRLDLLFFSAAQHYQILALDPSLLPETDRGHLAADWVEAARLDVGGGGNCLALCFAYGLNLGGFAAARAAGAATTELGFQVQCRLRRRVVSHWISVLDQARPGVEDEARALIDRLLLATTDELR